MSPQLEPDPNRSASHPRGSRLGLVAIAMMLIVATLSLPVLGLASEVRSGDSITVGSSELVTEDLYASAREFTLAGRANGDVYVAASTVEIPGSVVGSLYIAGGEIDISGTIGRTVRIVGGTTDISGTVSGDLMIFGGTTSIGPTASVDGDLLIYGGKLDLEGAIGGDVKGTVGAMTINGAVDGDVNLDVQSLEVATGAEIDGSLDYTSRQEADIAPGADVAGTIDRTTISPWGTGDGIQAKLFSPLVRTLWLLVAGLVMIALAPRFAAVVSGNVRRPWIPAIVGLVSMVLLPFVAILLMVSIIGLPVGLILFALFVISLYLSQVIVGQRLGTVILPRRWNDGSRGFALLAMTIGVILISALRFVPLPYVSALTNLVVAIIGLGAVVLLVRQLRPAYTARQATAG